MGELLRVPLAGGGGYLTVEADEDEAGMTPASHAGERVHEAAEALEEALGPVRRAAEATLSSFRQLDLTSVELEFGVKLNASAGAILTKAGMEGHFVVRVGWNRSP